MDISEFPNQKRAIFRKIKEIKELRGDVPWYVKPEIPQIDKEIAEKGRFRTETNYGRNFYKRLDCVKLSPLLAVLAGNSDTFLRKRKSSKEYVFPETQ